MVKLIKEFNELKCYTREVFGKILISVLIVFEGNVKLQSYNTVYIMLTDQSL